MKKDYEHEVVLFDGVEIPVIIHDQIWLKGEEGVRAHMHNYIEMLFCVSGKFEIWLDGRYFQFEEGDLVVINSREVHRICLLSDSVGRYICTRFVPEILYTSTMSSFDFKYVIPFVLNNSKHQRIFKKAEIEKTFIPSLMHELLAEQQKKEFGYEIAVKTDISRIFLWIVRYWHSVNADLSCDVDLNKDMILTMRKALDFVSANYMDDIKAYEVADMCNLSYSYFSRIFKQYMKKSFTEYLNYIRVVNAERLLISTDYSVTEIAIQCGFTTSSYFIQQFKRIRGISPKQYKKGLNK